MGVTFLMTYYGVLDRAPKRRDEREGFQLWIHSRDEYASELLDGPAGESADVCVDGSTPRDIDTLTDYEAAPSEL